MARGLEAPSDWNSEVNISSVESYIQSSSDLVNQFAAVSVPVILVHAQNDPIVAFSQFQSFSNAQQSNPHVLTFATQDGSHCGFLGVYGAGFVSNLINRAVNL